MLLDYKIKQISYRSGSTELTFEVFTGDQVTAQRDNYDGTFSDITVYKRQSKVIRRTVVFARIATVNEIIKFLNIKLSERAALLGVSVITEQSQIRQDVDTITEL